MADFREYHLTGGSPTEPGDDSPEEHDGKLYIFTLLRVLKYLLKFERHTLPFLQHIQLPDSVSDDNLLEYTGPLDCTVEYVSKGHCRFAFTVSLGSAEKTFYPNYRVEGETQQTFFLSDEIAQRLLDFLTDDDLRIIARQSSNKLRTKAQFSDNTKRAKRMMGTAKFAETTIREGKLPQTQTSSQLQVPWHEQSLNGYDVVSLKKSIGGRLLKIRGDLADLFPYADLKSDVQPAASLGFAVGVFLTEEKDTLIASANFELIVPGGEEISETDLGSFTTVSEHRLQVNRDTVKATIKDLPDSVRKNLASVILSYGNTAINSQDLTREQSDVARSAVMQICESIVEGKNPATSAAYRFPIQGK